MTMDFLAENTEKLAPYAIAETLREKAYEALPVSERAELKKTIARLFSFWGRHDYTEKRVREFTAFSAHEETVPCSYAIICCETPFLRGVELVPALLPALMAGVQDVVPWFLGEEGEASQIATQSGVEANPLTGDILTDDILMALELLGIEEAFYSTPQKLAKLLQNGIPLSQEGRFVSLGQRAGHDSLLLSLVLKQGVPMQYFAKGEDIYPSLTPQWYCNHSVRFLP